MDPIYIVGIVAVLVVGVAVGVLYAIPKTRPYVKKWWPVAVIIVATILIAMLFRRKPAEIRGSETGTLDKVIKDNESKLLEAQIKTEAANKAAEIEEKYVNGELDRINQIRDPYEQFSAKKRLLDHVMNR